MLPYLFNSKPFVNDQKKYAIPKNMMITPIMSPMMTNMIVKIIMNINAVKKDFQLEN